MLILGIFSGHDTNVALFDDHRMLAAINQKRMTRIKGAGGVPQHAIDECLKIAGVTGADVDAVMLGRNRFALCFFTRLSPRQRLKADPKRLYGREMRIWMEREMRRHGRTDSENLFDAPAFLQSVGLPMRHSAALLQPPRSPRAALPVLYGLGRKRADSALHVRRRRR